MQEETSWKGKNFSMDNKKWKKRKGKLLPKNEEIPGRKAHTKIQKLIDIFQQSQMSFSIRRE